MVIAIGWGFINPANHTPFIPEATTYTTPQGMTHAYGGIMGILGAAGVVFFAYIGFDAVSTAAQEAKDPEARHADRHPRLAGDLHGALRAVLLRPERRGDRRGLPDARAERRRWRSRSRRTCRATSGCRESVTVAILAGFSSVILVMLLGQSRVFFSMSHDGLVPKVFSEVHPRYRTPYKSNMLFFVFTGAVRGVHPRGHRGRDDEHRDAVCVHPGLRGRLDHARPPARHRPRLHGPGAACRGDPRHHHLRGDDLRAGVDQLDAARRVAGHRPGVLLRVRDQAQQARRAGATRGRRRSRDGCEGRPVAAGSGPGLCGRPSVLHHRRRHGRVSL